MLPYEVQLRKGSTVKSVIVEQAHLSDRAILKGFDPYFCPIEMMDHIQFTSNEVSGIIWPESPVHVVSVCPTDEPVPEPDPKW